MMKEDLPATEPVPAEIAERLARHRIVLSSADAGFDPRQQWTKVKGSKGAWELVTREPVSSGLFVEKVERVEPGSLGRTRHAARDIEPFRPPWQPFIYHPRRAFADVEPRKLRRKSGAKVWPHNVFNHDDREGFYPNGYPWHCVGRVFVRTARTPGGWLLTGTGTLVGKRTVLTSAHMIPWDAPGLMIRFVPGYHLGIPTVSVLLTRGGTALESWITNVRGYKYDGRAGRDIAVLRLAEPLGEWLGTFGYRGYDDDWEDDPRWTLVGYPLDIGFTLSGFPPVFTSTKTNGLFPTRQFGISVEDDDSDGNALEIEHRGDASPGNSGGPLFGFWPEGPYLIGVHSGGETIYYGFGSDSSNVAAGGNAMVELVHWARGTWV